MDAALSAEKLRLFWFFAMPGVIILYARAQFIAGRMPPLAEGVTGYLIVSVVYHAVLFPIAQPLYATSIDTVGYSLLWFLYILAGPMVAGFLLGLNVRRGWLMRLLAKANLHTVHAIGSAWDWRFSNCEDCFTMVVLKDGTRWAGYLGERSFMSSIPTERDIFLEKVYGIADDDSWRPRDSGVWIAHGEIQSIEFWPNHRSEYDGQDHPHAGE